jgi:mRNA interferase RelE/StbE
MSYAVIWLPEAMTAYRRLRAVDPDGAKQIANVVAGLAAEPRPAESSGLGGTNFRRIRLERYRLLYEVTDDAVRVMDVGRVIGR